MGGVGNAQPGGILRKSVYHDGAAVELNKKLLLVIFLQNILLKRVHLHGNFLLFQLDVINYLVSQEILV